MTVRGISHVFVCCVCVCNVLSIMKWFCVNDISEALLLLIFYFYFRLHRQFLSTWFCSPFSLFCCLFSIMIVSYFYPRTDKIKENALARARPRLCVFNVWMFAKYSFILKKKMWSGSKLSDFSGLVVYNIYGINKSNPGIFETIALDVQAIPI